MGRPSSKISSYGVLACLHALLWLQNFAPLCTGKYGEERMVMRVRPLVCKYIAGGAMPKSTQSSGDQLGESRLMFYTYLATEVWAYLAIDSRL